MRRLGTLLLAATLLVSCKDSTGNNGGSRLDIGVTAGTRPTYTWEGTGHSLSVVRTADPGTIVWGVAGTPPISEGVMSPVTHGTVPGGTIRTVNTEPVLTAGVQYRVTVTLHNGTNGWKDFTP